ncbi:transposase [Microseira wollei]|uniref:transposase n=1 Tax=Microseira wollei TaxID=467598 RepID=UPI001CFCBD9A
MFVPADHTTAPVEIAKTMKSISAVHIFNTFKDLKRRCFWGSGMWSDGTFYSSVGGVSQEAVRQYIETQKQRGDSLSRKENACVRGHPYPLTQAALTSPPTRGWGFARV